MMVTGRAMIGSATGIECRVRRPAWWRRTGTREGSVRVLVVEDSERLRASLVEGLSGSGYAIDAAPDGREGLARARAIDYDAVVLDVMLPEVDGLTVLRTMRETGRTMPVLLLTARDRVEQRVEGLRLGADDYLVKPFALDELIARIEALCRRSRGHAANEVRVGAVRLDIAGKRFLVGDAAVSLTPREHAILELLMLQAGRVLSRAEIEEHVYDADRQVWSNAVDSAIAAIRRKLSAHGVRGMVRTRRGLGYVVEPERSGIAGPG